MGAYVIRRLFLAVPTLFLVTLLVFLLIRMVPGDVVEMMLVDFQFRFQQSDIEAMKHEMGIDVPPVVQYVRWMGGIFKGDLGKSLWNNSAVTPTLLKKLPVSFELGILAIIIGMIIALPVGIYSAIRQDTAIDYIARTFAILCISVPGFWLGTMVVVYPSIWLNWTPSIEFIPFTSDPAGNLAQFLIPATVMGMGLSGTVMRMTRTMMLEVLRQDYIRTAWAKGLRERVVITRHALKNAAIPVVTMLGLEIPILVGGAVVIEQIFSLPGIGRYVLDAIGHRDYVVIVGVIFVVAVVVLINNLVIDLTYGLLDPRIKYK